jgi:hypothetical protein
LFAMQASASSSQSLASQVNGADASSLGDPTSSEAQGHHRHHHFDLQAGAAVTSGTSGANGSTNGLMNQLLQMQAQLQNTTPPQSIATV